MRLVVVSVGRLRPPYADDVQHYKKLLARHARLAGQNGWTEIEGCPLYTNDDFPVSVQQFTDIMAKNPKLDAFIPTGGFPQFIPDANRAAVMPYKDKIASKALALVVADTLPVQIDQMKEGLSLGQVGQRPFEMGYKTMMALEAMKSGKPAPADPTYTGLDVCTPETVASSPGRSCDPISIRHSASPSGITSTRTRLRGGTGSSSAA